MPFRIDHVDARVPSLIAVERFYSDLLPALGAVERRYARVDLRGWTYVEPHERYNTIEFVAAGAPGRPFFGVIEEAGVLPSRSRIAFGVDSPEEVARIAELLPAIGARTIERSDQSEGSGYHAVFFEDPLGSRLEVVHRS